MAVRITAVDFGRSGFGEEVSLWRVEGEALQLEVLD